MPIDPRVQLFSATPAILGEGTLWSVERQSLVWVDIVGKKIFEAPVPDRRKPVNTLPIEQMIGAVVPARDGSFVGVLHDGLYRVNLTTGMTTPLSRPPVHDIHTLRFNDAKCDPQGRLWAGTLSLKSEREKAALHRFDPSTGRWSIMRTGVSISNGLAWSGDGRTLYYIDSLTRVVQAFSFDGETGEIGPPRVALDLTSMPGVPDGCTIDTEDCLWIAHWDGARVTRWDPSSGRLLDTLHVPVEQVTNCTFGGADLRTLFISTAATELDAAHRVQQPNAGHVFCAEVGATGRPAAFFGA